MAGDAKSDAATGSTKGDSKGDSKGGPDGSKDAATVGVADLPENGCIGGPAEAKRGLRAPALGDAPLSASEVRAYLRRHPDFIAANPDLLLALTPPSHQRGDNVLDMQGFMVGRLQEEVGRLKNLQGELIKVGRSNMSSQSQVHGAVLALLDARTFEHLIEVIVSDFMHLLDVDAVSLAVEATTLRSDSPASRGVHVVEPETVERLLGSGRQIVLRSDVRAEPAIYAEAAPLVRSDALIRIDLGPMAPAGLLALGSREARRFHPGQGTELLCFLARVVARQIRSWLDLPA